MIKPGHRRVDREGPGEPLSSYGAVDRSIKKRTHFGRARGCFWGWSGPRSHVVGGRPCGWWSIVGGMPSHGCIDSSQIESLGGGKADVSNAPTATPQTAGCGPLPNRGWCRNSGRNEIGCGNRCRRRARRSSARRRDIGLKEATEFDGPSGKEISDVRWRRSRVSNGRSLSPDDKSVSFAEG